MSEWKPIETAPVTIPAHDAPRVLVYGDCGIQMGRVYVYPDAIHARAEGFNGEWNITHWMPLPPQPEK